MTTDEINKYIHEQILGKCWHEIKGGTFRPARCSKGCGWVMCIADFQAVHRPAINPDYCGDGSPRSLLREVVEKVVSVKHLSGKYIGNEMRFDDDPFLKHLSILTDPDQCNFWHNFWMVMATAEQIARACVEAHKSEGDSK
jgi:hypothetical protein